MMDHYPLNHDVWNTNKQAQAKKVLSTRNTEKFVVKWVSQLSIIYFLRAVKIVASRGMTLIDLPFAFVIFV